MIRRVYEDARLVCLDSIFEDTSNANSLVNAWAERGRSKLKRLENEAFRVRKSVSRSASTVNRTDVNRS